VTITSESADNGGDQDLGISDDWIADNVAIQTRSSHSVWQPSFSNYFEKSAPSLSPRHGLLRLILQSNFDWRSIVSLQDSVPWQTYQDSPPNSGDS